jgi:acyl-CoA thioester hydrolase
VINHWLITEGGLDIHDGETVGFCVESSCRYHSPIAFPEVVEAALRVSELGNSSVRYEVGIFKQGEEAAAADGDFVHVFVDVASGRPTPIPETIRACLRRLAGEGPE